VKSRTTEVWTICRRLETTDPRYVEIESKKRVLPEQAKRLRKHLLELKDVDHDKRVVFYDQFLDTPDLMLLKLGASLRLRYKGDGSNVYLQYKGPGFHSQGVLFRSEFSSLKLDHVVREESHHDVVHFNDTSVRELLEEHVAPEMAHAMQRHLGIGVIARISTGPMLCSYQKDKFIVDLGDAFLEPSLDRIVAFHINRGGLHSVSTFWEYENEIKTDGEGLESKLEHIDELVKFDASLARKFDLRPERLDKYHRCASCFLKIATQRRPSKRGKR
jgi:hypothetical protein